MSKKYLRCSICGKVVEVINDSSVETICCGLPMEEIYPQTEEGAIGEKHVPVYKTQDKKVEVQIGSTLHPSTTEHFIEWITLETNKGCHTKVLKPGDTPKATFCLEDGESVKAVYAFCNIHDLWKTCKKDFSKNRCNTKYSK